METKKEFRWFSIAQHVQEQDYLREQHKKGWKFVKVTGIGIYHFEKCESEEDSDEFNRAADPCRDMPQEEAEKKLAY